MTAKVISLAERTEVWKVAYADGGTVVSVSSRGRMKIAGGDTMNFFDSVEFLSKVSSAFEDAIKREID